MIISVQFIHQFIKFVLVGFINTAVYFGSLNLFMVVSQIHQGWWYSIFVAIAFVVSSINSYFWNKRWTFQKGKQFERKEFSRFITICTISFFINVGIASFLNNTLGAQLGIPVFLWANLSALVPAVITTFINFFGSKYLVFER